MIVTIKLSLSDVSQQWWEVPPKKHPDRWQFPPAFHIASMILFSDAMKYWWEPPLVGMVLRCQLPPLFWSIEKEIIKHFLIFFNLSKSECGCNSATHSYARPQKLLKNIALIAPQYKLTSLVAYASQKYEPVLPLSN